MSTAPADAAATSPAPLAPPEVARPGVTISEAGPPGGGPRLGLVCLTLGPTVRYRTVTRTRYLALSPERQRQTLQEIYEANLYGLERAVNFCQRNGIRLYRISSAVFPLSDEKAAGEILHSLRDDLALIGRRAARTGLRMTLHPDQFVVLSSDSPAVIQTSIGILERHARTLDLLGLPRSTWAAMTLHGGKAGRAGRLVETVGRLPGPVRDRLTLENDERAYGAAEILDVCRRAGVPMIFDCHHHVCKEKLASYDHPSVAHFVREARGTWPDPAWQLCHLSNGKESFADPRHGDLIAAWPGAYEAVPWVDVEARGKEAAIRQLRQDWPAAR